MRAGRAARGTSPRETSESRSPQQTLAHARKAVTRRDPLWPEQLAVLAVILLSLTLPDELTVGPTWLLPAVEGGLFAGLVATTPRRKEGEKALRRRLRITLVSLMSAGTVASLLFLAHFGVEIEHGNGRALLGGAVVLWLTTVLLFALWYWEMDRGGPMRRGDDEYDHVDFVFPEMQDPPWAPRDWMPGIPDFLYLSFVNAATFAPPESHFPLTTVAKLMLSLQALGALATDTLIVARAVNLLG